MIAINWLESVFGSVPLPLLEVWGRFAYIVGLCLAIWAFGGFTFRIGEQWGFGRERLTWDAKAFLSVPLTFLLTIAAGFAGSFIVLVPGAQTFESLKDLAVLLCIVLFGYPALIAVPPAYMLSDLIEGVPPDFVLNWAEGYFFWTAFVWMAYQLIGRNPDFRRVQTWWRYCMFVALILFFDPVMWGFICSEQFTTIASYRYISSALAFTLIITWLLAPVAFFAALPLARRLGWFWAEIPGRVRERAIGSSEWIWESGRGKTLEDASPVQQSWPIRVYIFTPFIILLLVMVWATAFVALQTAKEDAESLATSLHQAKSENIRMQLDDYLARSPSPTDAKQEYALDSLLAGHTVGADGRAFIIERSGNIIGSSAPNGDALVESAVAALVRRDPSTDAVFRFNHVTAKPLSRETWLVYASTYRDESAGRDWVLVSAMPEAFYLAGSRLANSRSAMLFAVALVLSLLLAAALASLVTAPLRSMARATQMMARGKMGIRVPGSRLDELTTLAESFNDMAVRLKESFDDLVGEVERRKNSERELKESEARRIQASAAVQKVQAELAQVARLSSMGELSASIAHEINQPLAAVAASGSAALRWLTHDPPNLSETKNALDRIIQDTNRAAETVGRIREFLKHRQPEFAALDINQAIRDVVALTSTALKDRSVTIRTALPASTPPVLGDRIQLQQVIMNLIMNGADAMEAVANRPRLMRIETQSGQVGTVMVTVSDSGTGIDEAIQDRIFDALFTTKPTGMGLGLSICRSIIEVHGGRLWASPGAHHGTTFQFTVSTANPNTKPTRRSKRRRKP